MLECVSCLVSIFVLTGVEWVFDFEGIANVRCHITQMILWCNVKVARTGNIVFLWLRVDFVLFLVI